MANVKWIQANQSQTKAGNYKKKTSRGFFQHRLIIIEFSLK